jgi:hypothetical protein
VEQRPDDSAPAIEADSPGGRDGPPVRGPATLKGERPYAQDREQENQQRDDAKVAAAHGTLRSTITVRVFEPANSPPENPPIPSMNPKSYQRPALGKA